MIPLKRSVLWQITWGIYIIDSKTNKGNYYLKNKTVKVVSALSKLKIEKESVGLDINEAFIDVEKFKKHQISNDVNEYLVKWKG